MKVSVNKIGLGLIVAMGLSACGQGMQGYKGQAGFENLDAGQIETVIQSEKIENSMADAEVALAEAEKALDDLSAGGFLAIPGMSTSSLTGLPEKLGQFLDKILDKISIPVAKANEMIELARTQLNSALVGLDPANPAQAGMIARIQEGLAKLDEMQARLSGVYQLLADKIDFVIGKLDELIAKLSSSGNPVMIIPVMELTDLRNVLVNFRDKVAAL